MLPIISYDRSSLRYEVVFSRNFHPAQRKNLFCDDLNCVFGSCSQKNNLTGVHEHVQPLQEEIKIRTHVDKVCSLWPLNLDWDIFVFVNFRFAIFQFCISPKYAFSDFLQIGCLVTSFALVPKLATRLCNLHCHIAFDCHIGIIS